MNIALKTLSLAAIVSLSVAACGKKEDTGKTPGPAGKGALTTHEQKLSYAIGYSIGTRLGGDRIKIDLDAFMQAIRDTQAGKQPALSKQDMIATIKRFRDERRQAALKIRETMNKMAQARKKAGEDFLAANGKKKGIVTTKSGLQYQVIKAGTGKKPKATDRVVVHYRGTLHDGKEFDSSYKRNQPASFQVNGVIKGWQEVLPLMKEGAKWKVFIPQDLAYGARGAGRVIGPYEMLVFEIELVKVK